MDVINKKGGDILTNTNENYKTITQIELETGKQFIDIYNELSEKGLSQTEIARQLGLRGPHIISSYLHKIKLRSREKKVSNIRKKLEENNLGFDIRNLENIFPKLFNIEYRDFLYQKYIIEGYSKVELAELLGCSIESVERHLKLYNIKKSLSQARQDAIERGKVNYKTILSKARKTLKKSKHNSYSQELIHTLIQEELTNILAKNNIDHLEVVVGLNEWGILRDKEVDIPIIIIDLKNNTFSKYSLEVQGEYWHRERQSHDKNKSMRLTKNGWKHFEIETSNIFSEVDNSVKNIAKHIIDDFLNNS